MRTTLVSAVLAAAAAAVSAEEWTTGRGWEAVSSTLPAAGFAFPERTTSKSAGIAYSGGGARSFALSLAQHAALKGLDCLGYESGVSGGSWALAVDRYGNASLGVSAAPGELSPEALYENNSESARAFPSLSGGMFAKIAEELPALLENRTAIGLLWERVIYDTYLKPLGLSYWTKLAAVSRDWPFPIFAISIWAPDKSDYAMIEATPQYVGQPAAVDAFSRDLGGLFEPALFDCADAAFDQGEMRGRACSELTLTTAIATSSWAIGALLASYEWLGLAEGVRVNYTAPGRSAIDPAELCDGGNVENVHLSGLIQRNLTRLFVFFNAVVPLSLDWDAAAEPPAPDDVSDDFSAMFGYPASGSSYNYSSSQLFDRADFPPLVAALQDSVRKGLGAVATTTLRTVRNDKLGVAPDVALNVTFSYLAPAHTWHALLPDQTKDILDADPVFHHFPHFSTARLDLGLPEVNALASLATFVIDQNPSHFSC